ncbi:MAG: hypothetical protein LBD55_11140 [Treponema sp.]|nr:hypothetical protein [Treponema sp.]
MKQIPAEGEYANAKLRNLREKPVYIELPGTETAEEAVEKIEPPYTKAQKNKKKKSNNMRKRAGFLSREYERLLNLKQETQAFRLG